MCRPLSLYSLFRVPHKMPSCPWSTLWPSTSPQAAPASTRKRGDSVMVISVFEGILFDLCWRLLFLLKSLQRSFALLKLIAAPCPSY